MASCSFHEDATSRNRNVTGSDELNADINISSPPVTKLTVENRFDTLEIFKRPLCLVSTDNEMNLQINDKVLHQISQIDVPISVVGVCGVYKTGKSYLMNLLAQERTGFQLGSTIRSHTKGILVWCKPHPTVSDQVLVLLDTEGLADAAKGDEEHDMKLFCLTMLMSSVLIYNMKGVIDQDALKKLSFVTDLTKQVSVAGKKYSNEEGDKVTLQIISPHFVLCLRDFYLDLVDEGELTPDEYMESCLSASTDKQDDKIRGSITNFFPNRTCFVLAQPALNEKLKGLEKLDKESIAKRFWVDVEKLQTFVYNLDPKCLNGIARNRWDGTTFEDFLRAYIQDISLGDKLEYGKAMEEAGKHHNEKLERKLCRKFSEQLDTLKLSQPSKLQIMTCAINSMHELLEEFRRDAYPYKLLYYQHKAEETMMQKTHALVDENSRQVVALCLNYLERKHTEMIENSKGEYRTEGGFRKYHQDYETLLEGYDKLFDKYSAERCDALQKFNDSIQPEVSDMKYEVKQKEAVKKYEVLLKRQHDEMEDFMKMKMKTLKETQEKEIEEKSKDYNKQLEKMKKANAKKLQEELNTQRGKMKKAQEKKVQEELSSQKEMMKEALDTKMREKFSSQREGVETSMSDNRGLIKRLLVMLTGKPDEE